MVVAASATLVLARHTNCWAVRFHSRHCAHRRLFRCSAVLHNRRVLHFLPRNEYFFRGTNAQQALLECIWRPRWLRRLPCTANIPGRAEAEPRGPRGSLGAPDRRARHTCEVRKSSARTRAEGLEGARGERFRGMPKLSYDSGHGCRQAAFEGSQSGRNFSCKHAPITGGQLHLYRLPQGHGAYAAEG